MQISSSFRRVVALAIVSMSVFIVTGCQEGDTPAPLPDFPAAKAPPVSKTTRRPASSKNVGSAESGARQPRFGEMASSPK
jgi:hypothetical protein